MNSNSKIPCIPIEGTISWEDWLQGRKLRRQLGERVVQGVMRRDNGPGERRMRRLFNGERGLPFTPTEEL